MVGLLELQTSWKVVRQPTGAVIWIKRDVGQREQLGQEEKSRKRFLYGLTEVLWRFLLLLRRTMADGLGDCIALLTEDKRFSRYQPPRVRYPFSPTPSRQAATT